jgi:molybdenum cofactor cytidylyltransferase
MIFGLVPAAGKSSRMGRPKLLLPLGGRTVLEQVLACLKAAGVERTLVVIGPHVPELIPLARASGAEVLALADETPDMRATVEQGLTWLEQRFHPGDADDWLLLPADHPTLHPTLVRQVLAARAALPAGRIIIPTYQGRRGHPTLISWQHVVSIRALPSGEGLNAYLRRQAGVTVELAVESAEVLLDLDTPEDYERMRGRHCSEPEA